MLEVNFALEYVNLRSKIIEGGQKWNIYYDP